MRKQLKLRSRFAFSICLAGLLYFMLPGSLRAGSITYTSSAAFLAATTPNVTENYSTFTNGQDISSGFSANGFTYSAFVLTNGATALDITNKYNSISGLSLGADHTALGSNETFFFGGEGATITFSKPVTAFGMFFNVNLDSGTYGFCSIVECASTGSASYDTGTFVFAGLTSSTPFSSITFDSTGADASYNVPELLATTSTSATPEPSSSLLFGIGLVALLVSVARSKRRAPSTAN